MKSPSIPSSDITEKGCTVSGKEINVFNTHVTKKQLFPTFTIGDDFPSDAVCVVGSSLYMFDCHPYWGHNKPGRGKYVYKYEIPSNIENVHNFKLERYMLTKVPDLHQAKSEPIAIVTPDKKKVMLCSSRIWIEYPIDFEMFDPDGNGGDGLWYEFEGMPYSWKSHTKYNAQIWITNWAFIDEHVLLFETDDYRCEMFTIDIRYPEQPCRKLSYEEYHDAPLFHSKYGSDLTGLCRLVSASELVYETDDKTEDKDKDVAEDENNHEDENETDEDSQDEIDDENESKTDEESQDEIDDENEDVTD